MAENQPAATQVKAHDRSRGASAARQSAADLSAGTDSPALVAVPAGLGRAAPPPFVQRDLLALQRLVGNQATMRAIGRNAPSRAPGPPVQRQLSPGTLEDLKLPLDTIAGAEAATRRVAAQAREKKQTVDQLADAEAAEKTSKKLESDDLETSIRKSVKRTKESTASAVARVAALHAETLELKNDSKSRRAQANRLPGEPDSSAAGELVGPIFANAWGADKKREEAESVFEGMGEAAKTAGSAGAIGFKQAGAVTWPQLQEKASDVSMKLQDRVWKMERYYSFQLADNDQLGKLIGERKKSLVSAGVKAGAADALAKAGLELPEGGKIDAAKAGELLAGAESPIDEVVAAVVPPKPAKKGKPPEIDAKARTAKKEELLKGARDLAMLSNALVGSEKRMKLGALSYVKVQGFHEKALATYDFVAEKADAKGPPAAGVEAAITRVASSWEDLRQAQLMRKELKAAKAAVKAEGDAYGDRAQGFGGKLANKIKAGVGGAVLSTISYGEKTLEKRDLGGGYRTEVVEVERSEQIKKIVETAIATWHDVGGQGAGLGGKHAQRAYAVLKAVADIFGMIRPAFTSLGIVAAGLGALFGLVGLVPVAAGLAAVAVTCTGINAVLTLGKLAIDMALGIWAAIQSARAVDPRARLNTGTKARQQAVATAVGAVEGAAMGYAAASAGGVGQAFDPSRNFHSALTGTRHATGIIQQGGKQFDLIPGASGTSADAMVGAAAPVVANKGLVGLGTMAAYPLGGSSMLSQAEDQGSGALDPAQKAQEGQAEQQSDQGAQQVESVAGRSDEVSTKLQGLLGKAESGGAKKPAGKKSGKLAQALTVLKDLIVGGITAVPRLFRDMYVGIRAATKAPAA